MKAPPGVAVGRGVEDRRGMIGVRIRNSKYGATKRVRPAGQACRRGHESLQNDGPNGENGWLSLVVPRMGVGQNATLKEEIAGFRHGRVGWMASNVNNYLVIHADD